MVNVCQNTLKAKNTSQPSMEYVLCMFLNCCRIYPVLPCSAVYYYGSMHQSENRTKLPFFPIILTTLTLIIC